MEKLHFVAVKYGKCEVRVKMGMFTLYDGVIVESTLKH